MEKERRKGTWRQVALLLLVAAFLVSGTGIFKKKIEENGSRTSRGRRWRKPLSR